MAAASVEASLQMAREILRPEALRAFEAAWEWAAPRTRTDVERQLVAATLALFSGCQALLVPRRLPSGALASLHLTGTRGTPSGPVRCHLFAYVTPEGLPPPDAEPDSLCFSAAETRAAAFRCAARMLGELLTRLGD
jgi:hypothetical protein